MNKSYREKNYKQFKIIQKTSVDSINVSFFSLQLSSAPSPWLQPTLSTPVADL